MTASDALLAAIQATPDPNAAITAFEGRFWTLPLYPDAALLDAAAERYRQAGRPDATRLLGNLARMKRREEIPDAAPDVASVLVAAAPADALQHRLELLDRSGDAVAACSLIRAVFAHAGAPIGGFWALYRASRVFAALRQADEAFLFASMTLQVEPTAEACLLPAREVLQRLAAQRSWDDAADLLVRWQAAQPGRLLLGETQERAILARAAPRKAEARQARVLVEASVRPAVPIGVYGRGVPYALEELRDPGLRPAITLAEVTDAVILVAGNSIAVHGADGVPLHDLCVGPLAAGLVAEALERRRTEGEPVDSYAIEDAVLISDEFAAPSLCHFMLDQATRLPLYQRAGFDLAQAVVIGPNLARPYQRQIARRLGATRYIGTGGHGEVRARRLGVLSNCRHLRHPAHLGADWALQIVRQAFGLPPEQSRGALRLLVSREDAARRHLTNEQTVESVLASVGFTRIVPGRMTLDQQVAAFSQASHVVGLHGAALANLAFCPPQTEVLEIFHPLYGTYAYAALAPSLRLRYAAMVGRDGHSDAPDDNDPALALARKNECIGHDVRADLGGLVRWIEERT